MNRLDIIQGIIQKKDALNYLEIGVQKGKILFNIQAPNKIGVDPNFIFPLKTRIKRMLGMVKADTYELTSDAFFEQKAEQVIKSPIDVALIDGLHTYEQVVKDVTNTLPYLAPDGVIILHDCNPTSIANAWPVKNSIDEVVELAKRGEVPGWNGCWNGDVWKAVAHLRISRGDLDVFTLDIDWGLGVIRKAPNSEPLTNFTIEDIQNGGYELLEQHRVEILNLKHPKYYVEFLESLK